MINISTKKNNLTNYLSLDLEHGIQTFKERKIPYTDYAPTGEVEYLSRLLNKLRETKNKATFFVLTSELKFYTDFLFEAISEGHEVASHGHDHIRLSKRNPSEFKSDIVKSKSLLEEKLQIDIVGYRAPGFSLAEKTQWAFEIIKNAGFRYSSSSNFRFKVINGLPSIEKCEIQSLLENLQLLEFPSTSINYGSLNQRICGGFFTRALPKISQNIIFEFENQSGRPVNFYYHPFECDVSAIKSAVPLYYKFLRYYGVSGMEQKVHRIIETHRFTRFCDLLPSIKK